jgi:hypothetical protein
MKLDLPLSVLLCGSIHVLKPNSKGRCLSNHQACLPSPSPSHCSRRIFHPWAPNTLLVLKQVSKHSTMPQRGPNRRASSWKHSLSSVAQAAIDAGKNQTRCARLLGCARNTLQGLGSVPTSSSHSTICSRPLGHRTPDSLRSLSHLKIRTLFKDSMCKSFRLLDARASKSSHLRKIFLESSKIYGKALRCQDKPWVDLALAGQERTQPG